MDPVQIPPQQAPTSTVSTASSGKFFLLAGIAFFLVLAAMAVFILSPKKDTTPLVLAPASWVAYTDPKEHYSIKYPKETFTRVNCPQAGLILQKKESPTDLNVIEVTSCPHTSYAAVEIRTIDTKTLQLYENFYQLTQTTMHIAGRTATKYVGVPKQERHGQLPYGDWFTKVVVENNDTTYEIHLSKKELENTFSVMLSSLRFPTPQTQTPQGKSTTPTITNGETYTSKANDFRLVYPFGWKADEQATAVLFYPESYGIGSGAAHFRVTTTTEDPEACKTNCPSLDEKQTITFAGDAARRLEGYAPVQGSTATQKYISVSTRRNGKFYVITFYQGITQQRIRQSDFEQLLASFVFY